MRDDRSDTEEQDSREEDLSFNGMQAFDRQINEVSLAILNLRKEYPRAAVYAAMLDLLQKDYYRDLKERYGEENGEGSLPPRSDDT